jgi:hypothetical protein
MSKKIPDLILSGYLLSCFSGLQFFRKNLSGCAIEARSQTVSEANSGA